MNLCIKSSLVNKYVYIITGVKRDVHPITKKVYWIFFRCDWTIVLCIAYSVEREDSPVTPTSLYSKHERIVKTSEAQKISLEYIWKVCSVNYV